MPPAGTHTHIIHQYAPLLQFEPKLTLRGLGAGKDVSSCCGERREQTTIWTACLCVFNAVHPCCPCLSCTHTCPLPHLVRLLECGGKVAIRWCRRHDRHIGTIVPQVQEPLAADLLRTEALQTRGGPRWEGEGRGEERRDNDEQKVKSVRVERCADASMPAEMCATCCFPAPSQAA